MTIDKQRITAVRKLEQLGYTFAGDDWMHPTYNTAPLQRSQTRCMLCWSSAPTTYDRLWGRRRIH